MLEVNVLAEFEGGPNLFLAFCCWWQNRRVSVDKRPNWREKGICEFSKLRYSCEVKWGVMHMVYIPVESQKCYISYIMEDYLEFLSLPCLSCFWQMFLLLFSIPFYSFIAFSQIHHILTILFPLSSFLLSLSPPHQKKISEQKFKALLFLPLSLCPPLPLSFFVLDVRGN